MDYRVKKIEPAADFNLLVYFRNGIKKQYDIKPLFKEIKAYKAFVKNPNLFNNVQIICGGYGIKWTDKIDLASEELWDNGITI